MMSVVSTTIRTASNGVAIRRAPSFDEELLSLICGRHRVQTSRQPQDEVLVRMDLHLTVPRHPDPRVHEERTEDVEHEMEPLEQGRTGDDERRAEHESAEDPPEQHAMLQRRKGRRSTRRSGRTRRCCRRITSTRAGSPRCTGRRMCRPATAQMTAVNPMPMDIQIAVHIAASRVDARAPRGGTRTGPGQASRGRTRRSRSRRLLERPSGVRPQRAKRELSSECEYQHRDHTRHPRGPWGARRAPSGRARRFGDNATTFSSGGLPRRSQGRRGGSPRPTRPSSSSAVNGTYSRLAMRIAFETSIRSKSTSFARRTARRRHRSSRTSRSRPARRSSTA